MQTSLSGDSEGALMAALGTTVDATGNPNEGVSDLDKLREQLTQWGIDLDWMDAKATASSQEVRAQLQGAVTDMRTRISAAQKTLEEKAEATSQETHAEIQSAVSDLQRNMSDAQEKLEQLPKQGAAASEEMEKAFQSSWDELKEGFERAMSKFEQG